MGYEDGTAWGMDEYGRRPKDDDPKLKAQRDKEWKAFQQAKKVWEDKFGKLTREDLRPYL